MYIPNINPLPRMYFEGIFPPSIRGKLERIS